VHDHYWLTSPPFNTSGATNLKLIFWRWLNSDYTPYMENKVEVYDGSIWVNLWTSGGFPAVADSSWKYVVHDVTQYANVQFRVRFGFKIGSSGVFTVSGWNVDDVVVVDWPGEDGPGICCDWDSDCDGLYVGAVCETGACTP